MNEWMGKMNEWIILPYWCIVLHSRMLVKDPDKRPSATEITKMPFIAAHIAVSQRSLCISTSRR